MVRVHKLLVLLLAVTAVALATTAETEPISVEEALSQANNVDASLRATVTQKGADYIRDVGVDYIERLLLHHPVDDVHEDTHSAIGHLNYDITNIDIHTLKLPKVDLKLDPSKNGVLLNIRDCKIGVSFHFHVRRRHWPHVSKKGDCDAHTESFSGLVEVSLGQDGHKRPTGVVSTSKVDAGNFHIDVHTHAGWLVKLILSVFKKKIHENVNKSLNDAVPKLVNKLCQQGTSKYPLMAKIDDVSELDTALAVKPYVNQHSLNWAIHGEVYRRGHHQEPRFRPNMLPNIPSSIQNHMMLVTMSEFVPNTLSWVYNSAGKMNRMVTQKDIPPSAGIKLDTKFFKDMIPPLYAKYPDRPVQVLVHPYITPMTHIAAGGKDVVDAQLLLDFKIVDKAGHLVDVFELLLTIKGTAHVKVAGPTISGKIDSIVDSVKLSKTEIGPIDPSQLASTLDIMVQWTLLPQVNAILAKGFTIPMVKGVQLKNTVLATSDLHSIIVGSDFVLHLPTDDELREMFPEYMVHVDAGNERLRLKPSLAVDDGDADEVLAKLEELHKQPVLLDLQA